MRTLSVLLAMLCLPLIAAVSFPSLFVPVVVAVAFVALLITSGRFYLMTGTAWAQITAVGFSLQIGGTILGWAPESWFSPGRVAAKRSMWPNCLAVTLFSAGYSNGVRTAFGIDIGSARVKLITKGRYRREETAADLGWQFWLRQASA